MAKAVSAQSDTALTSPISQIFPYQKEKRPRKFAASFAERQVLETIIKYIITMMPNFILNTLIYGELTQVMREVKYY